MPLDDDLDPTLAEPVDSDEEKEAIMTAVARSLARPQPLISPLVVPLRRQHQLVRMKEMLSNAMNSNRSGNLFSVPTESANTAYHRSAPQDNFLSSSIAQSPAPTNVGMAQPGIKVARNASLEVG